MEPEEPEKNEENQQEEEQQQNLDQSQQEQPNSNPIKKCNPFLKRTTKIGGTKKAVNSDMGSNSRLTIGGYSLSPTQNEGEIKAEITRNNNKYELESKEETEEYLASCLKKIEILKRNKKTECFNINLELSTFKWEERNLIEFILPSQNSDSVYIYNIFINKIEQISIKFDLPDQSKFPSDISFLVNLPYCFVSGGKILTEGGEIEELNNFYSIRRIGDFNLEIIDLPNMIESKSNHCMCYISYNNSIAAIGGLDSRDCEIFDLVEKKWESLPDLNETREGACCCIINMSFLYTFFGYDTENEQFVTSIEKLDLDSKKEWELINPFGNESLMKRQFAGILSYRLNFEENVLIVGGKNILGNESKECLIYNPINNTIDKSKQKDQSLPLKAKFNNNCFFQMPNKIWINLTYDFQLIQYEQLGRYFYGIRHS